MTSPIGVDLMWDVYVVCTFGRQPPVKQHRAAYIQVHVHPGKKETDTEKLLRAPNQGRNPGDEVYDGFRVPPFFALACRADFCHTLSTSIQKDKVGQHKTA